MEGLDAIIQIIATSNTQELGDVPPAKMKAFSKSNTDLFPIIMSKRWNITLHPTHALAQEARKSYESYCDFVYNATLRDWGKMAQEMQVLSEKMAKSKKVRLVGKETDISFSIEGRKPIVDDGKRNLPGGEVFTSPVEESVNGKVHFDLPINLLGQEIKGVRLVFKNGEIVDHSAELGGPLLDQLLSTDEGAKRIGELGIGMNRSINESTKSILFDEKMGDTIHMAVGHAFEECGGKNVSGIHIDMIKSMKDGGVIYFDESPIYKDGKFVWEYVFAKEINQKYFADVEWTSLKHFDISRSLAPISSMLFFIPLDALLQERHASPRRVARRRYESSHAQLPSFFIE